MSQIVPKSGGGVVLQALGITIAEATGTTTIPNDDTIPLNSEGTEIGSQAITLASNSNKVLITGGVQLKIPAVAKVCVAIFRGSTCIQSRNTECQTGSDIGVCASFGILDSPATAGAVTYSVRIGSDAGAAWGVGADDAGNDFGDTLDDGILLMEIEA